MCAFLLITCVSPVITCVPQVITCVPYMSLHVCLKSLHVCLKHRTKLSPFRPVIIRLKVEQKKSEKSLYSDFAAQMY
jgi:hypothetical protein